MEQSVAVVHGLLYCIGKLYQFLMFYDQVHFCCISDDVLVEEEQSTSVSLPSLMTPPSAAGMSLSVELTRKRKGSVDNQYVWDCLLQENLNLKTHTNICC